METAAGWRVVVGPGDVIAAQRAWVAARVTGAPAERVDEMADDYNRVRRTWAQQEAERVRVETVPTQRRA